MAGRLEFYYYETKPGVEAGTAWGQLAGASHRLHFVCREMESCPSDATVEHALERLEYHMENYLVRIYELRERAVALAATLDGRPEVADIALRNQHTHDKFLSVGIWTDNDIYDPAHALVDLSTQPDAQEILKNFLKEEMQRLVDEHVAKGRAVFDATWAFLDVVGPEMRTRRPSPCHADGADAAVADL